MVPKFPPPPSFGLSDCCCRCYYPSLLPSAVALFSCLYPMTTTSMLMTAGNTSIMEICDSFFPCRASPRWKMMVVVFFHFCSAPLRSLVVLSDYCTWKVVKLCTPMPKNANRGCMVLRKVWKLEWNWKHLWTYTAATFHIVPVEHRTLRTNAFPPKILFDITAYHSYSLWNSLLRGSNSWKNHPISTRNSIRLPDSQGQKCIDWKSK